MNYASSLPTRRVAILLGTWNGASYLLQQLDSYARQTHSDWCLYVSDDGSKDGSLDVVQHFRSRVSQPVEVVVGPQRGFAANYLSLVKNPTVQGDYFAFSDQDDIWHSDKLERALAWLEKIPDVVPGLYCSRTDLVDAFGAPLGRSSLYTRPPSFQNALVENIGGANTMVFNRATKQLLEQVEGDIVSHDWTAYQLVTAVGGQIWYDSNPSLCYRQHTSNAVGSNRDLSARLRRIQMLFAGRFAQWTEINISILRKFLPQMTPESQRSLQFFMKARAGVLPSRIYNLKRSGAYRQTVLGNLGLVIAAMFRRL
ncbi:MULTISPECIES: glycosyltransferase family 2 protein [unclassified Bradyrhizobium]|nr:MULTISPECIES: glycosyltransferase family 2 protein [unclassified Bradyrhizobium]